jgi:YgiT-type zinc finger domain-containing protein
MKCHVCGATLTPTTADMPFRTGRSSIVVIKKLPVLECTNCTEFLIEDPVMAKVEDILNKADASADLEVVAYAA